MHSSIHVRDAAFSFSFQKRSDKEKVDLMTFKEIRERLANRDAIREAQETEEWIEAKKEARESKRLAKELAKKQQLASVNSSAEGRSAEETKPAADSANATLAASGSDKSAATMVTAAADTSSEVAKKIKDKFLKEMSRVIVKLLDPYRRPEATTKIISTEDFKHLAKKVRAKEFV